MKKNTPGLGKNAVIQVMDPSGVNMVDGENIFDAMRLVPPSFLKDVLDALNNKNGAGEETIKTPRIKIDEPLEFKFEMPGLGKEHVSVSVEKLNVVVITGTEPAAEEFDKVFKVKEKNYSWRIPIPTHLYKVDRIKAEMKNGLLKVVIPPVLKKEKNKPAAFKVPVA